MRFLGLMAVTAATVKGVLLGAGLAAGALAACRARREARR